MFDPHEDTRDARTALTLAGRTYCPPKLLDLPFLSKMKLIARRCEEKQGDWKN